MRQAPIVENRESVSERKMICKIYPRIIVSSFSSVAIEGKDSWDPCTLAIPPKTYMKHPQSAKRRRLEAQIDNCI